MATLSIIQLFQSAEAHAQSGDLRGAQQIFRRIVEIDPNHADATHYLGMIAFQTGEVARAVELLYRAARLAPRNSGVLSNLGVALKNAGRAEDAADAFKEALAIDPANAAAHNNFGNVLLTLGQHEQAIESFNSAIRLQPDYVDAHINLGTALANIGQLKRAIEFYRRAITLNPRNPQVFTNLGVALGKEGNSSEAIDAHRTALAIDPANIQVMVNLGIALMEQAQFDEAIVEFRRALELDPNRSDALQSLASSLQMLGFVSESIEVDRQCLQLGSNPAEHSNLLLTLHYRPIDPKELFAAHLQWASQHADALSVPAAPFNHDRDPDRRLRIGYVSPDFRGHSVARFAMAPIGAHDRARFEVICFDNSERPDAVTDLFKSHANGWHRIREMSDDSAAALIRSEKIDILVDLAGHTACNRLLTFARRPAPIQVTYLGYPDTTGMRAMDYRFTDAVADPPGLTEASHSEKLVRLPNAAWCFAPSADAPPVAPLPMLASRGRPTLGSFNSLAKISPQTVALWSRCLHAVPESAMLLKATGLGNDSARQSILRQFAAHGIEPSRLTLLGPERTTAAHLSIYSRCDLALDTYPYHGTTTTCEAFWMGVPVVTRMGAIHVSRVSGSLLGAIGLGEFAAESDDAFVATVTRLLANRVQLAELLAAHMRDRLMQSPLLDATRFARGVEAEYRSMWRAWCASDG